MSIQCQNSAEHRLDVVGQSGIETLVLWVTGAVLTVPGFRLASNYNYASTAISKILLFDALIMIYGK